VVEGHAVVVEREIQTDGDGDLRPRKLAGP